jgi:hypothetical protein
MSNLEHIEAIEKHLWSASDNLRASFNCASNEYFLPDMGLVFLRHAYSRHLAAKKGLSLICSAVAMLRECLRQHECWLSVCAVTCHDRPQIEI